MRPIDWQARAGKSNPYTKGMLWRYLAIGAAIGFLTGLLPREAVADLVWASPLYLIRIFDLFIPWAIGAVVVGVVALYGSRKVKMVVIPLILLAFFVFVVKPWAYSWYLGSPRAALEQPILKVSYIFGLTAYNICGSWLLDSLLGAGIAWLVFRGKRARFEKQIDRELGLA